MSGLPPPSHHHHHHHPHPYGGGVHDEDEDEDEDLLEGAPGADDQRHNVLQESQDRLLPQGNVYRIMRTTVNTKISDSSKILMQECASEFVSFVTSEAADRAEKEGRKVLRCEDLLEAMNALGFEHIAEPLAEYTKACRQTLGTSKRTRKQTVSAAKKPKE